MACCCRCLGSDVASVGGCREPSHCETRRNSKAQTATTTQTSESGSGSESDAEERRARTMADTAWVCYQSDRCWYCDDGSLCCKHPWRLSSSSEPNTPYINSHCLTTCA